MTYRQNLWSRRYRRYCHRRLRPHAPLGGSTNGNSGVTEIHQGAEQQSTLQLVLCSCSSALPCSLLPCRAAAEATLASCEAQLQQPQAQGQGQLPGSFELAGSGAAAAGAGSGRTEEVLALARCAAASLDGWAPWELGLHAPLAMTVDLPALQVRSNLHQVARIVTVSATSCRTLTRQRATG